MIQKKNSNPKPAGEIVYVPYRYISSTSSYRYVRPESVDLHFHQGWTWSVDPYVAKPAVLKDYIVAPDCPLIDLHGCTLCEICIVATEIKSVLIGRPRS